MVNKFNLYIVENPLQNLRLGEDFSLFEEYAGDLREKEWHLTNCFRY